MQWENMSSHNAGYQRGGKSDEYQYRLRSQGYMVPLVADVHFNPKVADVAAQYSRKGTHQSGKTKLTRDVTFKQTEYTDEEYAQELQKIRDRFVLFLISAKRIVRLSVSGVNHGFVSDRIMSRYGETPKVW